MRHVFENSLVCKTNRYGNDTSRLLFALSNAFEESVSHGSLLKRTLYKRHVILNYYRVFCWILEDFFIYAKWFPIEKRLVNVDEWADEMLW